MELGNRTLPSTHSPSSGSRSRANAVKTFSAMWPLPRMLSQDITVNGSMPLDRRRTSASVTRPNVVAGTAAGARSAWTSGLVSSNSPVAGWKL